LNLDYQLFHESNGIPSISPGLRGTRYSGSTSKQITNPNEVASSSAKPIQPVPGCDHFDWHTQRRPAAPSYAGLNDSIPLGFFGMVIAVVFFKCRLSISHPAHAEIGNVLI
jgi:hypothetical protein